MKLATERGELIDRSPAIERGVRLLKVPHDNYCAANELVSRGLSLCCLNDKFIWAKGVVGLSKILDQALPYCVGARGLWGDHDLDYGEGRAFVCEPDDNHHRQARGARTMVLCPFFAMRTKDYDLSTHGGFSMRLSGEGDDCCAAEEILPEGGFDLIYLHRGIYRIYERRLDLVLRCPQTALNELGVQESRKQRSAPLIFCALHCFVLADSSHSLLNK